MWVLIIRSPSTKPREHVLKPGTIAIGRKSDNDIVITDESASRRHAEIDYVAEDDRLVLRDLDSRNGTYVNRERLTQPHTLRPEDQIRIGQHIASVAYREENQSADLTVPLSGTQPLTRDLLLESIDQHAILLYEVSRRLNTILDLEKALAEVSKLMQKPLGAARCEVILSDRFGHLAEMGYPPSVAYEAIEQRSVVVIPDLAAEAGASEASLARRIHAVLCVPVIVGEEVAALTFVYKTDENARAFDQYDVQLAVAISHQAALTIQRARLLEQARSLERVALLDSLTGLRNRRSFLEAAEREYQRARRYGRPLTAIMLDIDGFKSVNDTHGHAVGDQVLLAVAARCRDNLRDIDLLSRYGGDEFAVLLLESDEAAGRAVAERVRACVADTSVETDRGPLDVSISLGVCALTPDCPGLASLINDADSALYAAKNAGRNRVEVVS